MIADTLETVSPRSLTAWTSTAATANDLIQAARMELMQPGSGLEPGQTLDGVLFEAQELTERLRSQTRAGSGIHAAPVPGFDTPHTFGVTGGIDLFALDTPDTRALLAHLDAALAVAERVDASRGRVLPAHIPVSPSESRGTDLAEVIAEVASRVRQECHGATGKGLE